MQARVRFQSKMQKTLHYISVAGTFMTLYGILYAVQDLTIGRFPLFSKSFIFWVPLKLILFTGISFYIIFKYIKIGSNYEYKEPDHS
ncbi:hypothetical protein A3844_08435 [Paenibacillus helianthi]|uniref:Uncharacterized protein n=1 Tax=Paenibacillus helianthi TaxID=1349432 RepID=A0ABX3ES11_9BACL|nr:hypothetical protein A3844_08435 [Paenibacillus helianthi]